jgi:hypothetical protein
MSCDDKCVNLQMLESVSEALEVRRVLIPSKFIRNQSKAPLLTYKTPFFSFIDNH